ncbi:tight junction protein ZO-1-like isoform X2 [Trichoplusia ni]|uniref:Tight junction protein ZO-1-like isoform X2 n=1 Tax=Trichoplusia ni TaxID=7111 RepID=A0A7E5W4S6_TRINI|nr:tight junction protein ZO-1-like isoform X2 [Trichoplusia ni]
MAAAGDVCAGLLRHKHILLRELCDTNILDVLVKKGIFNLNEFELITGAADSDKCNYFIEIVSKQSGVKLNDLCVVLSKECPKLSKELMNDRHRFIVNGYGDNTKENMVMNHNLHRESPRSRRSVSQCSCNSISRRSSAAASPMPMPLPPLNNTVEMYVEPVVEDTAERSAGWETHRVRLNRVPGYGFGIAVSGGRDNPHFASGDPSIAVSDVLRGGPAEDKLQVNDRIVSVNGVPLENVEYARAVQVLRDSGATVSLVVRRRAPAPPPTAPTTIKLSLTRNGKKEDFGLVLGCKLYVKELTMRAREQLNQGGQGLCEGDMVTRINNTPVTDAMTLKEARKLIESCKDRLNLVVTRELIREETVTNGNYQNNYNSLEASPLNVYGAAEASPGYSSSGQNLYVAAPVRGGDARRGPMSHEQLDQPPRPPPPRNEDYYSSRRQLYEEEAMNNQRNKPSSEPRLISFQKEGSVGLRLCGGNRSGVFVSGVQPTSPAALQGLQPADKILKFCALEQVNDMEMKGVTREEAVLFLLSLQDRIDLIVQHAPDDYNAVASGQMPGDSFHIKTHFHYTEPTDGEMSFRCGDVFHVVDTLHNGTVGAWQVYRIGRNNQEVQKGTIPNKARAEELATAQFNATKKEMSGNDGKHNFFRRRRSTHRRSKSLGKEHWDEVVLSDSISKFPAYERVVLKQPGFVRPVIVLGAVADIARERLLTESPDKFSSPKMDSTLEDTKTKSTGIIRLSSIRTVMERGKHALLDITPNAVDRLNYAQFYPIVIFLKADNKHIIKQLRAGLPKSAHKSSKKLLEQCQHMERVWGHVFTHTITLSEANQNTWFSKLIDLIQRTQQQQLWVSETKRPEPLSDDFLFSMSSSTENRLSYASSPESDLEVSPPPAPRLVKSSSDPSIATTQDNMDRDDDINHMADAVPPPYTQGGYGDSKYGFSATTNGAPTNGVNHNQSHNMGNNEAPPYQCNPMTHSPPHSPLYGTVPELPPRGTVSRPAGGVLLPAPPPGRPPHNLRHNTNQNRPSAQERLFGPPKDSGSDEAATYTARPTSMIIQPAQGQGSLDRHRHPNNPQGSYDGTAYDYSGASNNGSAVGSCRLPPNAPDDLKVAPPSISKMEPPPPPNPTAMSQSNMTQSPQRNSNSHEHNSLDYRSPDQNYSRPPEYRSPQSSRPPPMNGNSPHTPMHARGPSLPNVPTNDHAKYSGRTNSASQADYTGRGGAAVPPYKPVPPPKPKHYRPPDNHHPRNGSLDPPGPPAPGAPGPPGPPGAGRGFPPAPHYSHQHSHSQPAHRPHNHNNYQQQNMYGGQMPPQSPPYSGPPSHHRAINLPHNPHLIDLAGSREQRGSAFELYRKPQHMHNLSSSDAMNSSVERDETFSPKTKKKLSKKPSFIKNAVLDLFRSKTKNSQKVSRQKSLCESDLQQRHNAPQMPMLRREKSDLGDMSIHMRNTQIRNQMLQRSNSSSCEKPVLKPILKRQSSFCDERNGSICTVRDYDAKPVMKSLRRQNSMCDIETEPKVTPLLRRQNSLIEYNRRGIYGQTSSFNMITKIDPIYQRQQQVKHEPFHPTQPLPPEPLYQSKDHIVYDPIPKPRRTYTSIYDTSTENPYASRSEMSNQSFENPYGNRQTLEMPLMDPPYATRAECIRESPYATRNERIRESPYATREECIRESPYATREECLRENPYATRNECGYASRNECMRESPYATRSELIAESPYTNKQEMMAKQNDSLYSESPYSSKEQMLRTRLTPDTSYATKEEMLRQRFSESPYSTKEDMLKQRMDLSAKEPLYGKRTYDPPPGTSWNENNYGVRSDRRLQTPVNYPGRISPMSKCMSEPPYATRTEMMARLGQTESPYATRAEVKSSCSDTQSQYSTRHEMMDMRNDVRPASAECTYVSKQEILSQKAAMLAKKESTYGIRLEEKLEIIKQRNQAKKEMIYQTRKEANESDAAKIREPLYVSKRDLKESVIYESHQEAKEVVQPEEQESSGSSRSSPYELGDANHLSRREPVYQTKAEAENGKEIETFQEIDFSKLRLTESKTDAEKQKSKNLETSILKGEPMYAPRLHGKADHISNALKVTTAPVPYESTTSMETQYASECSMNFENKPQSTPYTSQDLLEKANKPSRSVTFCEQILEKSQENSEENSQNMSNQNETTVIQQNTTVIPSTSDGNETNGANKPDEVEPDGPHTTWGIFDSEGGVLEDRQWGVSLIIPPKAIAPGIKQKIYFTVSDPRLSQRVGGPPIDMDNGEAMLSPLVMCGPQGLVFLRPVTLRLPHCANAVPSLGLTIKATDTEAHLSTDWDQIHLPATTTLNTVAVKVDHF